MDLIFIQEVTNMKKEKIIKIKEELAKKQKKNEVTVQMEMLIRKENQGVYPQHK